MSSFLYSTFILLLFLYFSLSLPTPISSHNNLHPKSTRNLLSISNEENSNPPIPKSKTPPKDKKPIPQSLLTPTNKTKQLKPKKTNSTISTPISLSHSKLNKTLTTLIPSLKPKLNKTIISSKSNTTNSKPLKPLKSNSTKSPIPKPQKTPNLKHPPPAAKSPKPKTPPANWIDEPDIPGEEEDDDIISEFRGLPSRLQSALLPDLHKLSATSKLYLSKTHREIAAGVKPFVGKRYAPSIASAASAALLLLPLLLAAALLRRLVRAGGSAALHRALLFAQAYLAIYFATLSLTAVATGLEPLGFFHAASPGAYAWTQAAQTLGYVAYLIAQLIALVVAFSAGEGEGAAGKAVGLAQMLLGLAVGMHYYITVFHRAVAGDPPRANWRVHGVYAACFVVICGLGQADRRKKAYYMEEDGGDYEKKS